MSLGPVRELVGTGTRTRVNHFLRAYHYLGPLPGWKACGALFPPEDDLTLQGVVLLGIPASYVLASRGFIEIRRLCLGPGAPKNAASYLLGWATRWARTHGYERVVSYADPSAEREGCPGDKHRGRIYLAANFRFDGETKDHRRDGGWSNRPTRKTEYLGPKLRFVWEAQPSRRRVDGADQDADVVRPMRGRVALPPDDRRDVPRVSGRARDPLPASV